MSERIKVLYFTNIPAPYRVNMLEDMGKFCELTVVFEKTKSVERNKDWEKYEFNNFSAVFLKGIPIKTDSALSLGIFKFINSKQFDYIVCDSYMSPSILAAVFYMQFRGIPYYLESDGDMHKDGKGIKEQIKKIVISKAKGCFSTCKINDAYFTFYGAKKEAVYRYPFTSLWEKDILKEPPSMGKKYQIRKELQLVEQFCIVSVGRFSYLNGYGKGYDTILHVAEIMPKNIGFYIIGDKPTEEFVKWKAEKDLSNVHFLPFYPKDILMRYYQAADLSMILSRGDVWGLVVNESMANGTPVISSDACTAGVELISNKKNGYIVPVNNVPQTISAINDYLSNEEHRKEFPKRCLETIRNYTFENAAVAHINVFFGERNDTN